MFSRRLLAVLVASVLSAQPVFAAAPAAAEKAPATKSAPAKSTKKSKAQEEPQAKIAPLWGLVFAAIKSSVFSAFSDWLSQKVFGGAPIPSAPPSGGIVPLAFLPQPQQNYFGVAQPAYPPAANAWQPQGAQAYPGQQPGYPAAPPAADPWAQQQVMAGQQPGMPGQAPGYPAPAQPYPGQQPGYPAAPPAADPWAQQQAMAGQGMPGQQPGYPAAPQSYPGQPPGYPAAAPAADPWQQQQAMAGQQPGMPGQPPGYPAAPQAYPGAAPAADPWQQVLQSMPGANTQQPYPGQPSQPPPLTLGQYKQNLKTDLTNTAIRKVSSVAATQMTKLLDSLFAAKSAPVLGQPSAPLKMRDGTPNYQALHVAIVVCDKDGRPVGLRPVSDGFRTGDRIKLRVVSTFDGAMTIANINPNDERRQIYPAKKDEVVTVRAGQQMLLPLGTDEFFEFRGAKGTEQLVLTLVDPRALAGGKASRETVHRQDVWYGSNFAQTVSADSYPVITQTISLLHH